MTQKSEIENRMGDKQRNWIYSVKATLGSMKQKPIIGTVRMVPTRVRKSNDSAYDPCVVSIGPIHHGKTDLAAMEEHKWRYFRNLVMRTRDPESTVDECCNYILKMGVISSLYPKELTYDVYELAEITLIDGCFILELLVKKLEAEVDQLLQHKLPLLRRDLMLLENQLPFFVLEVLSKKIFPGSNLHINFHDIANHVLSFLREDQVEIEIRADLNTSFRHIVEIVHKSYSPPKKLLNESQKTPEKLERCATELVRDGVQIEGVKGEGDLLNISVEDISGGEGRKVLKIPQLRVNEATETNLRNLIAFEQCNIGCGYKFTSYAFFLKGLICSHPDLELLRKKKVIKDKSDGRVDLLKMFQGLTEGVHVESFCYGYQCSQLLDHGRSCSHHFRFNFHKDRATCSRRVKKYWRILRQDYFPNPWRIIQLIAALAILVMTGLQAYYSVKK